MSRQLHPSLVDLALAAFYLVVIVAEAFTDGEVAHPWLHALVGGGAMAMLAFRRVYTLTVSAGIATAVTVLALNGGGLSIAFGLVVIAFTIGSETEGWRSLAGLAIIIVPYAAGLFISLGEAAAGDVGAVATFGIVPWLAGRTLRQRAEHLADARAHAARLELEREHEAERAAERERTRLARELHDVVSHSISVIAIQAQAVRRRLPPEQRREIDDLAEVETTARDAMAEMRRLFGVLRQDGQDPGLAPQPGLAEVGPLLERVRGTGLDAELTVLGEPHEVSPGLDLAAYRIVQEAVTNAMRHSGGRRLRVTLTYAPTHLEVCVDDDGAGLSPSAGHGHGLRGIRERAEMYGGELRVGSSELGGTGVLARLPMTERVGHGA